MADYKPKAKLGLNRGKLTKFTLSQSKNGYNYMSLVAKVAGRDVYGSILEPREFTSDEEKTTFLRKLYGDMRHIVTAYGFTDKEVDEAFVKAGKPTEFLGMMEFFERLMPRGYEHKEVDIFLQYQYKPRKGQTRTYLEIPTIVFVHGKFCRSVLDDGAFFSAPVEGEFEEVKTLSAAKDEVGLEYINPETNASHPFTRNGYWITSAVAQPYGTQTVDERKNKASGTASGSKSDPTSKGVKLIDDLILLYGESEVYEGLKRLLDEVLGGTPLSSLSTDDSDNGEEVDGDPDSDLPF